MMFTRAYTNSRFTLIDKLHILSPGEFYNHFKEYKSILIYSNYQPKISPKFLDLLQYEQHQIKDTKLPAVGRDYSTLKS